MNIFSKLADNINVVNEVKMKKNFQSSYRQKYNKKNKVWEALLFETSYDVTLLWL